LVERQQERNEVILEKEKLNSQYKEAKNENKDLTEKYKFLRKVLSQKDKD